MRTLTFVLLLSTALVAHAQEGHNHEPDTASPYAGMETRDIKALSPSDIDGLLSGAGMGYALAAELNGYPGPRHVLELADELALTHDQRSQTEALFAQMQAEAIAVGKELIEHEAALDAAFAAQDIEADDVATLTARIGATEARLRAVHLKTHLVMTPILTQHQRHLYQQLRGYGNGEMDHSQMDHGEDGHDH